MNKLSWLLYAAGTLDELHEIALATAIFCGVAAVAWWFAFAMSHDPDIAKNPIKRPTVSIHTAIIGAAIVAAFIPSATTVYMIAGSEASEVAVKSEIGQKVMTAVEKAIDSYTKKDNR